MRAQILALLLILIGCASPNFGPAITEDFRSFGPINGDPMVNLSPFTYVLRVTKDGQTYFGKSFIVNGIIVGPQHMNPNLEEDYDITSDKPDIWLYGQSEEEGLDLCPHYHGVDSWVHYHTTRGVVRMVIDSFQSWYYMTNCEIPVLPGDSGSPVLCNDHEKVVGVVSGRGGWKRPIGYIAKLDHKILFELHKAKKDDG